MILSFNYKSLIACSALILLMSSCATLLNSPFQKVTVAHDNKCQVVSVIKADSSIVKKINEDQYWIQRTKSPVNITLKLDSTETKITMHSRNSFAYWYNIAANYGIGMLIDYNNKKRYGIQPFNYVTIQDNAVVKYSYAPERKDNIYYYLSIPIALNLFKVKSVSGNFNSGGPLSLSGGVQFYNKPNKYFSAGIGASTDRFAEHLGKGYYQSTGTAYANLQNHFIYGKFDVGYGISMSELIWANNTIGDTVNKNLLKRNITFGLSLSGNYRLGKNWFLSALYQPGLFTFGTLHHPWGYQHYISIGIISRGIIRKRS